MANIITKALLNRDLNLTPGHQPRLERQIAATHQGQAHFAELHTYKTCGSCEHWVRDRRHEGKKCGMFRRLQGRWGPPVPAHAIACKYFEVVRDK